MISPFDQMPEAKQLNNILFSDDLNKFEKAREFLNSLGSQVTASEIETEYNEYNKMLNSGFCGADLGTTLVLKFTNK